MVRLNWKLWVEFTVKDILLKRLERRGSTGVWIRVSEGEWDVQSRIYSIGVCQKRTGRIIYCSGVNEKLSCDKKESILIDLNSNIYINT